MKRFFRFERWNGTLKGRMMRLGIRGAGQLKRWMQRALFLFRSKVVILPYHRVFEAPSDPQLLWVRPQHCPEHLELLCRQYRIVSLDDLVGALKEGRVPTRAVVITFDDGYIDNLLSAKMPQQWSSW